MRSFDVIGSIAVLKQEAGNRQRAEKILKEHKNIRTIVEKIEKVKGRLRTLKTRHLAGEMTKETLHKENNCVFNLNIDACYFSPRLASERLRIAEKIKRIKGIKNKNVLVMFSGIAPFSIVIAKIARPKRVVSVELGRQCCKYAKENVRTNKTNNIDIVQGDVKKINNLIKRYRLPLKYDIIIMPRPQLKDSFLKEAFYVAKKQAIVFYYDFCKEKELPNILDKVKAQARASKKRIKIIDVKKAGDIAPYKYRYCFEFKVL